MNEAKKTMIFGGVAVGLTLVAFLMSGGGATPDDFADQGEVFYPDFTDPNTATTLEVIEYDESSGSAVPFKVTFENGRWTIPSHHDYPADAKERLAKTAAGVIGIKKDDFRTDNPSEYAGCGVLDPVDETAVSLEGRGKRVTLKGSNGQILSDLIIGNEIPGSQGMRFARVPGEKRVYASRIDLDLSTKFADWIEQDLLQVDKDKITNVLIRDYSIDEQTGRINQRDNIAITTGAGGYKLNKTPKGKITDSSKVAGLLSAIDTLNIVGVRKKPAGLSASLETSKKTGEMNRSDLISLQNKGFFMARDGSLRSNEGELQVTTTEGVKYTLRFGEIVYGAGLAVTAGAEAADSADAGSGENRYLFVTTEFLENSFTEPPKPSNRDFEGKADSLLTEQDVKNKELAEKHTAWEALVKRGRERSEELNRRFADWYYVISAGSFDKLRLTRDDLVKDKPAES